MSPSPRVSSFVISASAALAVVTAACSGAAPQSLLETPSDGTSSGSAPWPTSSSGGRTTTTNDGPDAGATSGGTTNGGEEDSGASFGSPAPSSCPAGGVVETGGNDSESNAQSFTNVGCGTVDPGATDWWRFRLPASATKLAVNFSGDVSMSMTTEGTTIEVGSSDPIPFHPNANYDIQVTSAHSRAEAYVILVQTN